MAGEILRKAGVFLLNILKGILQVILFLLKLTLNAAKIFLLMFAMILRVFLSFFGISAGNG